jgi:AcrR family transcriptional regulator
LTGNRERVNCILSLVKSRVRLPTATSEAVAVERLPKVLRPTREPDFQQDRARRSYVALMDAAAALFARHGYDAVGTPEIAERAGVSVGTFYRYFDDKHEIYLEIARRSMVAAYKETIAGLGPERFAGRARHETISETIAALFGHVLAQPELMRSFQEMSLRDAKVGEVKRAFDHVSIARITTLISSIVSRDVVPDAEATAWVLYGAAMHTAYGLAGHYGAPPVGADRARKALTDFIERALFPKK